MPAQRLAVIDLGSNSFRLVVFSWTERWWKRTDEIYEPVRIGAGLDKTHALGRKPMERGLETLELFAHFATAAEITDVRPVATSAIRDASNQREFLDAAAQRSGLTVRVLERQEEADYGFRAAVNTTTLSDGVALDIGGGSMQLTRVHDRTATASRSWRLGAVRMTERFFSPDAKKTPRKEIDALREHAARKLAAVDWIAGEGLVGVGGAVRNLAAAVMISHGLPSFGVQGFRITRKALDVLVEELAEMPVAERRRVPGIKPERGDVILAAALVVQAVLEAGAFKCIEATEAGLREGVFLAERYPEGIPDVRAASVLNLAAQYRTDFRHARHVTRLALELWDGLADGADGREILQAAAMLHDIGTAVDYDDHHKHSQYLILNAGLPGFDPRETALIAQLARYHRKGVPSLGEFAKLARKGDEELLLRGATCLRLAEQLERPRDQSVTSLTTRTEAERVTLELRAKGDVSVAIWAAERERDLFRRAFGSELAIICA